MDKRIFDIGHARYKFNTEAFSDLMEEGRGGAAENGAQAPCSAEEAPCDADAAQVSHDQELQTIFTEVMQVYKEYARSGSMDALVRLKCILEEVSLRYRSLALAEEVLNINSCLPYERRVPCDECGKRLETLQTRH